MTRQPSVHPEATETIQVAALVKADTHSWLTAWADREHRSIASVVRQVLEERRDMDGEEAA